MYHDKAHSVQDEARSFRLAVDNQLKKLSNFNFDNVELNSRSRVSKYGTSMSVKPELQNKTAALWEELAINFENMKEYENPVIYEEEVDDEILPSKNNPLSRILGLDLNSTTKLLRQKDPLRVFSLEVNAYEMELNPRQFRDDMHFIRGIRARAMDQNQAAMVEYIKCLSANPNHYGSLINLAACLIRDRKFEEAIPLLDKALILEPRKISCYVNLATCHFQLGNLKQVTQICSRGLQFAGAIAQSSLIQLAGGRVAIEKAKNTNLESNMDGGGDISSSNSFSSSAPASHRSAIPSARAMHSPRRQSQTKEESTLHDTWSSTQPANGNNATMNSLLTEPLFMEAKSIFASLETLKQAEAASKMGHTVLSRAQLSFTSGSDLPLTFSLIGVSRQAKLDTAMRTLRSDTAGVALLLHLRGVAFFRNGDLAKSSKDLQDAKNLDRRPLEAIAKDLMIQIQNVPSSAVQQISDALDSTTNLLSVLKTKSDQQAMEPPSSAIAAVLFDKPDVPAPLSSLTMEVEVFKDEELRGMGLDYYLMPNSLKRFNIEKYARYTAAENPSLARIADSLRHGRPVEDPTIDGAAKLAMGSSSPTRVCRDPSRDGNTLISRMSSLAEEKGNVGGIGLLRPWEKEELERIGDDLGMLSDLEWWMMEVPEGLTYDVKVNYEEERDRKIKALRKGEWEAEEVRKHSEEALNGNEIGVFDDSNFQQPGSVNLKPTQLKLNQKSSTSLSSALSPSFQQQQFLWPQTLSPTLTSIDTSFKAIDYEAEEKKRQMLFRDILTLMSRLQFANSMPTLVAVRMLSQSRLVRTPTVSALHSRLSLGRSFVESELATREGCGHVLAKQGQNFTHVWVVLHGSILSRSTVGRSATSGTSMSDVLYDGSVICPHFDNDEILAQAEQEYNNNSFDINQTADSTTNYNNNNKATSHSSSSQHNRHSDSIFFQGLSKPPVHESTIVTLEPCLLLQLPLNVYLNTVHTSTSIESAEIIKCLQQIPPLASLPPSVLLSLTNSIAIAEGTMGDTIIPPGLLPNCCFVLVSGVCQVKIPKSFSRRFVSLGGHLKEDDVEALVDKEMLRLRRRRKINAHSGRSGVFEFERGESEEDEEEEDLEFGNRVEGGNHLDNQGSATKKTEFMDPAGFVQFSENNNNDGTENQASPNFHSGKVNRPWSALPALYSFNTQVRHNNQNVSNENSNSKHLSPNNNNNNLSHARSRPSTAVPFDRRTDNQSSYSANRKRGGHSIISSIPPSFVSNTNNLSSNQVPQIMRPFSATGRHNNNNIKRPTSAFSTSSTSSNKAPPVSSLQPIGRISLATGSDEPIVFASIPLGRPFCLKGLGTEILGGGAGSVSSDDTSLGPRGMASNDATNAASVSLENRLKSIRQTDGLGGIFSSEMKHFRTRLPIVVESVKAKILVIPPKVFTRMPQEVRAAFLNSGSMGEDVTCPSAASLTRHLQLKRKWMKHKMTTALQAQDKNSVNNDDSHLFTSGFRSSSGASSSSFISTVPSMGAGRVFSGPTSYPPPFKQARPASAISSRSRPISANLMMSQRPVTPSTVRRKQGTPGEETQGGWFATFGEGAVAAWGSRLPAKKGNSFVFNKE